ncbi:hypothetical protein F5X68DRAFT_262835 [Plectosphaerella plurivora]|uniref:N-acetyltransferase domain-containing protein n=1 Tax=Plectosphaerella plurivora TaxID=936078 RepID=A0A9P9A9E2_9PEZI|nr:hypothetical protein F5X68DRAFT_262835 [Plectosphaerella plurivora]
MSIRVATEDDIPVMVQLVQSGLKDDYIWKYCFPVSQQAVNNPAPYVEKTLRQFLSIDKKEWLICLVEEPTEKKIVAMALWHLPIDDHPHGADPAKTPEYPTVPSSANGEHTEDVDTTPRVAALQKAVAESQAKVLARYGPHMFLSAVITSPVHKRRGYAKLLCRRGMTLAEKKGVALAALVSPNGYVFYSGMKFSDCGFSAVQVPGEEEEIDLKTMVYVPPKHDEIFAGGWLEWFSGGHQHHDGLEVAEEEERPRRGSFMEILGLGHGHAEGRRPSQS